MLEGRKFMLMLLPHSFCDHDHDVCVEVEATGYTSSANYDELHNPPPYIPFTAAAVYLSGSVKCVCT